MYVAYTPIAEGSQAGTQDRNLEAGAEAETSDKCSLWFAQLFCTTQGHLQRSGTIYSGPIITKTIPSQIGLWHNVI